MKNGEIWIEKYRPRKIEEILGQEEVVKVIKEFIKRKTVPNLLLWGSKGTGTDRTSLVYALARQLYGEFCEENLLLIESSDFVEQGKRWLKEDKRFNFFYKEEKTAFDIFKQIVREYAALPPINAKFRILFFNNADFLPKALQQSLRRTMENNSKTSRFIFSTTKPAAIISPLRSRCLNLHFNRIDKSGAMGILMKNIAAKEGITLGEGCIGALEKYSDGDIGVAINMLEAAAVIERVAAMQNSTSLSSSSFSDTNTNMPNMLMVDKNSIEKVVVVIQRKNIEIEELIDLALSHRYKEAKKKMQFLIKEEGMKGREILAGIHEALKKKMKKKEHEKKFAHLFLHESYTDFKLCNSLNSMIHLEEMLLKFNLKHACFDKRLKPLWK